VLSFDLGLEVQASDGPAGRPFRAHIERHSSERFVPALHSNSAISNNSIIRLSREKRLAKSDELSAISLRLPSDCAQSRNMPNATYQSC
jgi:hypothetical protein